MARFRGTIKGSKGVLSRLGTASSGIEANINGWNIGVTVEGIVNKANKDVFLIHATTGSIASAICAQYIGKVVVHEGGFKFIPA